MRPRLWSNSRFIRPSGCVRSFVLVRRNLRTAGERVDRGGGRAWLARGLLIFKILAEIGPLLLLQTERRQARRSSLDLVGELQVSYQSSD